MATEAVIEDAFIDVFCDTVYGGGWMDTALNRACLAYHPSPRPAAASLATLCRRMARLPWLL
jgi:hypothetical protein